MIEGLQFQRNIGEGGFATVQKYLCNMTKMKFAVKKLKKEYHNDSEIIHRFSKEIELTQRLKDCPYIIDILDSTIDTNNKKYWYVMPLAKTNLYSYIKQHNDKLEFNERLRIFEMILEGIMFAHERGVLHRDLSPNNILIFEDDVSEIKINICDFGLGKDSNSHSNIAQSSVAGYGQWMFVDPDQLIKLKNGTNKSDIYSLGKILYFILTGKEPVDLGKSNFGPIITKAVNKEYEDVFAFAKAYFKFKEILMPVITTTELTVREYKESIRGIPSNWIEFYEICQKTLIVDHVYSDFLEPIYTLLSDEKVIKEFYNAIGSDIIYFVNNYIVQLNECYYTTGWPFRSLDSFTLFLERIYDAVGISTVKIACIKEMWYIAAEHNQWYSQDLVMKKICSNQVDTEIDSDFTFYISELGKGFDKIKNYNLNQITSIPLRRTLINLR
ncbi:serine/threonine-protein kinase [Bacillus massilinigeriensis]|uniref:serine/threonine-protein kinase n=1 Tax=Bacillus mediterraneensis TaxID=1805474 RepID=UPI0008F87FAD|nr:serine/threonine-protein kinase [Bacillus mediterraneensis]